MGLDSSALALWDNFFYGTDSNGEHARDIDVLESYFQAIIYETSTKEINSEHVQEFEETASNRIKTAEGLRIFNLLRNSKNSHASKQQSSEEEIEINA